MSFVSNSFCTPNAIVDELLCSLDGNALKCYLIIVRKTAGWGKAIDRISNTKMREISGIKDDRTITNACAKLAELGLIIVHKKRGQINEYELIQTRQIAEQLPASNVGGVPTSDVGTSDVGTSKVPTFNVGGVPTSDVGNYPHPMQVTTHIGCGSTKTTITKTTNTKDTNKKQRAKKFDAISELKNLGVDEQVAEDWITVRKFKKSPLTKTALTGVVNQAEKAGLSVNQAITVCVNRGWIGFKSEWIANTGGSQPSSVAGSNISTEFENYSSPNWGAGVSS